LEEAVEEAKIGPIWRPWVCAAGLVKGKGCIFIKMIKMELRSERKEGRGGGEGWRGGQERGSKNLLVRSLRC
jgi:hypothetical protein